jgi:O-acetyl-ADP-ribose deacetylase (regulator of RNase III)
MSFSRSAPAARSSRSDFGGFAAPAARPASRGGLRPRFDISLIAALLASPDGYAAYAGIGSRETPLDVLDDMTLIAQALEGRGFTLRSGFAGGADTAFELGTLRDDLREIFAPWKGFGANPNSSWDKPRWDLIRRHEARTGTRFRTATARLLAGEFLAKAAALAAQHHPKWEALKDSARSLHTRNMGQVLGPRLDTPARFVIAYTVDGQASGGTGQAIRIADALGIPVLNLHDADVRAEILRVLGIGTDPTRTTPLPETFLGRVGAGSAPAAAASAGSGAGVRYCSGDITADDADLLVNTVNCVGVMGKGVALAFKSRWPSIMAPYQTACRNRDLRPGGCGLFDLPDGRRWAGLATKDHWRDGSQLAWIQSGLQELARQARAAGVRSIALPPPGCGNGGLDWRVVEPLVLDALAGFDLRIYARPSAGAR